ncbi:MAG: class I SAM-dependent methyltransferase [Acidobacteria bacterium]|nr:class I SAM-dependent methyltransferase [Acidobacteriota bacterium]
MRRLQLFEWEDQPWLPSVLRDYLTDHLCFALGSHHATALHHAIAEILKPAMERLGTHEIVDLCSGGGGPLLAVQRYLQAEMRFETTITLTDLYPNVAAFRRAQSSSNGQVRACFESVSAFDVPSNLAGLRTLFTAFHHFRPADARRVLQDAARKRSGIAVLEPFERSAGIAAVLAMAGIIRGLVLTPRLGPMSAGRFALTYLLPVAPAVVAWDGIVSSLRSDSVRELLDLAASATGESFARSVTCLVGLPAETD